MKTWIEYSTDIGKYYQWISTESKKRLESVNILSFNAKEINIETDEFYKYCFMELSKTLINPEKYSIYMILNIKLNNTNSRVEHYKKCWKRFSEEIDLSKLELGQEIGYTYNENYYYSGIAKTSFDNILEVIKIVNTRPNKCIVFASRNDYFKEEGKNENFMKDYIEYNRYGDIVYTKCFEQCSVKQDISIRYGISGDEAEVALIFNEHDQDNIINV